MATLSVTPAVDRWVYQTDAFSIVFRAYDDNGERCRNDQLSIQYNITYDGTMPDLTQMQRVYSDASGLIPLIITKPCVISIYGICAHDVNDPSKGEVVQELAINYEISFQPVIKNITTEYIGPDIPISDKFNGADVLIKAYLSDDTVKIISPNDCIFNNYQITEIGPNNKYGTYTDPVLDVVWRLEFVVNGIPKLLSLEAEYIGSRRIMGERILPEEVRVHGLFLTSISTTERIELTPEEWYFIDIPIITEANNGIFRIGYQKLEAVISVPYDNVTGLRLNVWYEGDKIEVGKSYDPSNVVVYLVYPDGERKRISWKHCVIDSYFVSKEGWNWYTITYTIEFKKVTQEFPVEGIIYKKYIDLDFKVLYITNRESAREEDQEDLTTVFQDKIEIDGMLLFDWNLFLKVVNIVQKYGLYIVTVPKLCGMSNQYDMDWEVLCIDETTLKANIKKIYNEEDESHGEESNN